MNSKSNKVPEWSFTGENASVETGCFCNAEDCFQRAFIFCVSRLTGTEENALYFMCQGQLWVCRCRSRWPRNKEELRGASTHRALQSHRKWLTQDGISQICLEFRLCHMGSDKTEMQNRIRNHSKLWMKTGKFCSRNYEVERPRIEKWGAPQRQLPLFP